MDIFKPEEVKSMSWSGNCLIPKGTAAADACELFANMEIVGNEDCPSERDAASTAAQEAAKSLIGLYDAESDWVSTAGWRVNIGGHVNPGNLPREGWSNDYTNVRVEQVSE
jgi:hypothetical protein